MHQSDILDYYSRKDVQSAIANISKGREVVGTMRDRTYMKRPDVILYPRDVIERVKKGAVSFHCSVERWSQPLAIKASNLDELRVGWDLIIDIDSKFKLEHGRAAAIEIIDFLKEWGINPTLKFSGRRGFHVAIANEAFPQEIDFKPLAKGYPEIPRTIMRFVKEKCKERILEALVEEEGGLAALSKFASEMAELSPYYFVDVEESWGNRHLFRAPYSLHEKSWFVSVPIPVFKLKRFSVENAKPERVKVGAPFLVSKEGEGRELLLAALDWAAKERVEKPKAPKRASRIKSPVPERFFPPCIKAILSGLSDGRRRSLFTLIAFLRSVNWEDKEVEKRVIEANKAHKSPLSERMVLTQLKWHQRQGDMLPANCQSEQFYRSIGICKPDSLCAGGKIKNPVNYAFKALGKHIASVKAETKRKHKSVRYKRKR